MHLALETLKLAFSLAAKRPLSELEELLELGRALEDLQLRHLIDHERLLDHLKRVGQVLWMKPQPSNS